MEQPVFYWNLPLQFAASIFTVATCLKNGKTGSWPEP
jgi:hypothetical protein